MRKSFKSRLALVTAIAFMITVFAPGAVAGGPDESNHISHPESINPFFDGASDYSASNNAGPSSSSDFVSSGPTGDESLTLAGRGSRLLPGATTDVWAHNGFAYLGTFNSPCGDGTGANGSGIRIFDVSNVDDDGLVNAPEVGLIPSPAGSRSNDVKVAAMSSGDVLVHSNESCNDGPGGFEIWNVDDPSNPVPLASVQTDDVNLFLRGAPFFFTDFGVHNLFLFTQGGNDDDDDDDDDSNGRDYVAAVVESEFGNFQIFDITDPTSPVRVGFWGAEQLHRPDVTDWVNLTDFGIILDADAFLFGGFGASQNRFLHDMTITPDGTQAFLANWDAGLVLLDISDPTNPQLVSVALDPTSEDGEVNSHAVWFTDPDDDDLVVIEGEEDFAPFESIFTIDSGPNAGTYPSAEGAITVPIVTLPGQTMSGPTRYVGFGCQGSVFNPGPPFDLPMPAAASSSEIALIQRGGCFFSEKINNAQAAGYSGVVVFNDAAFGDALVTMGGVAAGLPGVFVGHFTGLAIAGVANAGLLVIGATGADISATAVANGWSGFRIWDYSDPANPVLASTYNTVCSADPIDPICDPNGTYSAHNVIVEGDLAYISWYSDGVLVLDIEDPYDPVEVARFSDDSAAFQTQNGGSQDVWGIYKVPDEDPIYASDRNGGLYVFLLGEDGGGDDDDDD